MILYERVQNSQFAPVCAVQVSTLSSSHEPQWSKPSQVNRSSRESPLGQEKAAVTETCKRVTLGIAMVDDRTHLTFGMRNCNYFNFKVRYET